MYFILPTLPLLQNVQCCWYILSGFRHATYMLSKLSELLTHMFVLWILCSLLLCFSRVRFLIHILFLFFFLRTVNATLRGTENFHPIKHSNLHLAALALKVGASHVVYSANYLSQAAFTTSVHVSMFFLYYFLRCTICTNAPFYISFN